MALYTVSSSGQLKITDTGVGSPVSVFRGVTTAIASTPLAGGFNTVYTFNGNYNRFSSRGNLKLYSGSYDLQGLLAGSALGEQPLGGGFAATQQPEGTYAFVAPGSKLTSNGNLVLTGTSVGIRAYQIESTVDLSLTSNVVQQSLRFVNSTGQLNVTGNKVAPSLRQFSTSGQITLTSIVATRTILEEDSVGQLIVNRTFSEGLKRDSSGQLILTGSTTTPSITLQPTSTGVLKVTTEWNTVNKIGSLSTETIAGAAIAAGADLVQNILNTTRIAFYGVTGLTSSGNLTITSYGTPDSDLTQDGTLAGSPLATSSITEHRFNTNSTQFRQLQNIDSAGQIIFSNAIKYRIETELGLLVLSGAAGSNNDRTSNGNLVTTTSYTSSSLRTELSSGQITLAAIGENPLTLSSSIAGGALASLPLSGGAAYADASTFNSLRTEPTSGNLTLSGVTSVGLKRLSSGQIVLSSNVVTRSLRNEDSSGQLELSSSVVTRSIRTEISSGQLIMANADAFKIIQEEESRGYLVTTGTNEHSSLQNELSSGQTAVSSVVETRAIFATTSNTTSILVTISQNPLTVDNSALAASPLASIAIAGGVDLPGYSSLFRSLRNEVSEGTLATTGTHTNSSQRLEISDTGQLYLSGASVARLIRNALSSGQLVLTGSDSNISLRNVLSSGTPVLTGSVVTRSLRNEVSTGSWILANADAFKIIQEEESSGQLKLSTVSAYNSLRIEITSGVIAVSSIGENPLALASGISGSALASLPLAGSVDDITGKTTFVSLRNELSSGNLITPSTLGTSSIRIEHTSGNLILSSSTVWSKILEQPTTGNLVLTGSTDKNITNAVTTDGNLLFSATGNNTSLTVSGTIAGSAIADHPIVSNAEKTLLSTQVTYTLDGVFYSDTNLSIETSSGNLVITGQSTNSSINYRLSSGVLVVNGTHEINRSSTTSTTSVGSLYINGSSEIVRKFQSIQSSTGTVLISGQSIAIVYRKITNESSLGNLIITGQSVVQVSKVAKPLRANSAGGGYVYASSWDILKPYFPDDRHILGYRDLKTSGIGVVSISGSSTATFIKGPTVTVSARKSLFDYIKDVEAAPKITPKTTVKISKPKKVKETVPVSQVLKQALLEDEMLLNGSLIYFESPEDELDRELTL
jgi:hypothetical protein